jgi:hypothetical protein
MQAKAINIKDRRGSNTRGRNHYEVETGLLRGK